jgi:hypothetical protein
MLQWMKRRRPASHQELDGDSANVEASFVSGKSAPLHKYLDDRFADAVVLTFAEIEDLVGFPLPALARVSDDWWTRPALNAAHSRFADSWILANRTARPNLRALTVAFDRTS